LSYFEVRLDCVRASSSPHLSAGGLSHARNIVNLDAIDALSRNPLHEEVVAQRFGAAAR
jgi:hypothetical protein